MGKIGADRDYEQCFDQENAEECYSSQPAQFAEYIHSISEPVTTNKSSQREVLQKKNIDLS